MLLNALAIWCLSAEADAISDGSTVEWATSALLLVMCILNGCQRVQFLGYCFGMSFRFFWGGWVCKGSGIEGGLTRERDSEAKT